MPAVSLRTQSKLARNLGLMASASALSLFGASAAQAACTPSTVEPLNNIASDNNSIDCNGTNTGQTIGINADFAQVQVNNSGDTLDNSTVTINGSNSSMVIQNGGASTGLVYTALGQGNGLTITGAAATNLSYNAFGAGNQLFISGTGTVTAAPGNIVLAANPGEFNSVIVSGALLATGNNGGSFLLNGGTGDQFFNIQGTLTVQPNGLAISAGDGNDEIVIGNNAVVNGGSGTIVLDGGNGSDILSLGGNSASSFTTIGIEQLYVTPGSGNTYVLGGTGSFGQVFIQGGTVQVANPAALGVSNSAVSIATNGRLLLAPTGPTSFGHTLLGGGQIEQAGLTVTYNGSGSTFTGNFLLSGGTAIVNSGSQFGSGTITNNAALELTNITLGNAITGTGTVTKIGGGTGTLGEVNSYSGGTDVDAGTLRITNASAAGSGAVNIAGGATFELDFAIDQTFANDIGGPGALLKNGVGIATLTGTNTYAGGTTINAGSIRVDDLARLGTGPVVANANGSLILNYSSASQLLIANPFLSGDGYFVKEGTGDVVLDAANTYTGGTWIRAGQLGLNDGGAVGTGLVLIDSGAELRLGNITFFNDIIGTGSVVKTASGITEIYGDNSGFTGTVHVTDGSLFATNGSAFGSGTLLIDSGTSAELNAGANSVMAADLAGSGVFQKYGGGHATLTGDGTAYSGTVSINNGTLQIAGTQNIGGATVLVDSAGTLQLDTSSFSVFNNTLLGAGNLIKTGTGTVMLTGSANHTGGTDIQEGAIRVTDVSFLGTGPVTVQFGAALDLSIAGQQTLNQTIAGAGFLRKSDLGDLTLTGNSLTGGVDIVGGRVIVGTASAIGSGPVTMAADTQLVFNNSTNEVSNTLISGAGTLTMNGTGSLVMNNSNSYTGGTLINSGRIGLNDGQGLGTGNVIVLSGAILGIGNINFGNNVSGAGQIVKTASGAGALTGTNSHTGGVDIQGGSLDVTGSAALGTGTVSIASGASLNFTNTSALTFSNGLTGAGTFNKLGTGQLTFANNFSIGSMNLNAGRTRMNVIGTTNVTVGANATLDGTGRIIGNLTNNGTVAPGNSIGTLTVQGNYVQNAGSVLEIEFDGSGGIDLLAVTGSATLNGGTLRFISLGGAEGQGGTFLTATGGVTGTFATVETVGAQLPLAVIYNANNAQMMPSVLTARPSTFNAQSLAAADTALGFIDSIGVAELRHGNGNRIWLNGFGTWGKRSASGSTLAYDHETRGISSGVNIAAGDAITVGVAFGWAKGDITLGDNGGGGDQSSMLGSIHARFSATGFTLGGGMLYGSVDQDTLRNVSFNGFFGSVSGSTKSKLFGGYAELGLPLGSSGGWAFSANARGSYIRQSQDAYTESGTSPLRLSQGDLDTSTLEGRAGLTAKTSLWDRSNGAEETPEGLDLRIDLGMRYFDNLGDRAIPVTFAVSNAGVVLQGDTRNSVQGAFGLGLDYTIRSGATFSVGYQGELGQTDRHAVQAGVSFAF